MGSIKVPVFASIIALSLTAPVLAADLPLPSVVPVDEVADIGSGWYLRGDLGYSTYDAPKWDGAYGRQGGTPPIDLEFSDTWSLSGGAGYRFSNWFRADVTGEYRSDSDFGNRSSRTHFTEGFNTEAGKLGSAAVLVNGYLDLGTWSGITPYVGAGLGIAEKHFHDFRSETTCLTVQCGDPLGSYALGPQGKIPRHDHTSRGLAWALTAGVAVELGSGASLDLGYRYLNLGEAASGLDAYGYGTKLKDIEAHEFRVGLRWMFAETGPAVVTKIPAIGSAPVISSRY